MKAALDSCRWVKTQLPRFLDGELPEDLSLRVSQHLDRCQGCRHELAAERDELLSAVALLVPEEPRIGLLDEVFEQIDREEEHVAPAPISAMTAPRIPAALPGLAAAAILAVILWALPGENTVTPNVGDGGAIAKLDPVELDNPIGVAEPIIAMPMAQPIEHLMGDVDSDGQFNESDIQQMQKYITTGDQTLACLAAADFNEDGQVTLEDHFQAVQMKFATTSGLALETSFTFREDAAGALPCNYRACP